MTATLSRRDILAAASARVGSPYSRYFRAVAVPAGELVYLLDARVSGGEVVLSASVGITAWFDFVRRHAGDAGVSFDKSFRPGDNEMVVRRIWGLDDDRPNYWEYPPESPQVAAERLADLLTSLSSEVPSLHVAHEALRQQEADLETSALDQLLLLALREGDQAAAHRLLTALRERGVSYFGPVERMLAALTAAFPRSQPLIGDAR